MARYLDLESPSIDDARAANPGAAHITAVDGGYMVFDTWPDHAVWAGALACPKCGAAATRNGSNARGMPKWRCKGVPSHTWSESTGRPVGRPATDSPSPSTVRVRRHREKTN